jgi:Tfp pilus assembly protein PilF
VNVERGDRAAAEASLDAAAQSGNAGRDLYYSLAELKSTSGAAADAARWYQKAADADPSWGKPRYKLGLLAMASGDRAAATRFLNDVLSVDPVSPEAALARTALEQLK